MKTVSRLLRGVPAVYLDLDVPQTVLNGLGDHHWQHVLMASLNAWWMASTSTVVNLCFYVS